MYYILYILYIYIYITQKQKLKTAVIKAAENSYESKRRDDR